MEQSFITSSGERLSLRLQPGARLGAGGQGQVFRTSLGGTPVAVKLLRSVDVARLEALCQLPPACARYATLPQAVLHHWRHGARAEVAGYVMPCIAPESSLSAARLFNFDELRRLRRFTWRDAVLAALLLAEAVAALHTEGVVIGDLNPENVLFSQAATPCGWRAVLLDSDSFQIRSADGQRFHCGVARPLYTAPELVGCDLSRTWRERSSDHFALAVLVYQLLLHDHPYDNAINSAEPDLPIGDKIRRGLYPHAASVPASLRASPARPAPQEVSTALAEAFQRSFALDPHLRPTAAEWVLLLRDLHRQVVTCSRTPQHHHPNGKPCPWCAVERRIGQPICRFPNATSPAPAAAVASTSNHWERLDPALRDAFCCHHQRAAELLKRREAMAEQLRLSNHELEMLLNGNGDSIHWLDQAHVQRRQASWRSRLSHWFGDPHAVEARRNAAAQLLQTAHANGDLVHQRVGQLKRQHLELQRELSALDLSPLLEITASDDPQSVAEPRLHEALSQGRERWLREQLSLEPLRTWQIEGFGDARLKLLESHGLCNGEQLRTHIDRLPALPGIGAALQARLRMRLDQAVQRLEACANAAGMGPGRDDLVLLPELLALQNGEQQLQTLGRALTCFKAAIEALHTTIRERRNAMEIQLKAFEALC